MNLSIQERLNLKAFFQKKGISQAALAILTGAYRQNIGAWLNGSGCVGPSVQQQLVALARELEWGVKMNPLPVNLDSIPVELKALPQWVTWRLEKRGDSGKFTKPPYNPANGQRARTDDTETWNSFEICFKAWQTGNYIGVGLCVSPTDNLTLIDIDRCAYEDGTLGDIAQTVLRLFGKSTYAEYSPSGTGIHIYCYGKPKRSGKGTNHKSVEIYSHPSNRYLTVTGHALKDYPQKVTNCQDALDALHDFFMSTKPFYTIFEKIKQAKKGDEFFHLWAGDYTGYPSQSEADLALCNHLVFWFGKDAEIIDRLFKMSGLYREKWDEKHHSDGDTYGQRTIQKALDSTRETYQSGKAAGVQAELIEIDDSMDVKPLTPDELNQLLVEPMAYPIEVFPDGFRALIGDIADYFQIPLHIIATLVLSFLSSAIGNTALIYFKKDFSVKPFLWSAIVEPSGFGKSPVIALLKRILERKQTEAFQRYESEITKHEIELAVYTQEQKEFLKKQKDKLFEIDVDALLEKPKPEIPILTEYFTTDFTFESLVPVFKCNPKGIIILKDEIGGLLLQLNQYKKGVGNDKENLLEMFNCSSIKVNRKGASPLFAKHSGAAIIGGIQPKVLPKIFESDSKYTKNDTFDNGLTPRFLFAINNSGTLPESTLKELDDCIMEYWQELIKYCINIEFDEERITKYYLDDAAKVYHSNWINNLNALYLALSEKARAFIPKLHLYSLKFALLLKAIYNFEKDTEDRKITIEDMQKAHKLTEFHLSQVIQLCKLYTDAGTKKLDAADKLLIEILSDEFQATAADKVLLDDVAMKYFARIKPGQELKDGNVKKKFNRAAAGKIRGYGFEVKQCTDHKTFVFRNGKKINELQEDTLL